MTASVIYNRRLTQGNWATMVAWGRNQSLTGWECRQRLFAGINANLS